MIITRLKGGLGNQLFQYAAGFALSRELNTELMVDGSFLHESAKDKTITPRRYELECFGIPEINQKAPLLKYVRKLIGSSPYQFLQRKLPGFLTWNYYKENSFAVNPEFFKLSGNVMLDGYWQSEVYFNKYREELLQSFTLIKPLSTKSATLLATYAGKETLSIHVRRGDLLSNPGAAAMHGVCSDDYYREAIRQIQSRVTSPVVIVFSDEPDYVREHMSFLNPQVIVDWNQQQNYEDLFLMQHCSHHIIANSSFSWWGAWMNSSPDKMVVAPKQWFTTNQQDTRTLIPEGWHTI